MIKFKLFCKECSKTFDSWFSSSKEFEKLIRLNYVNCINCNSSSIEKSLMAPNVLNSKKKTIKANSKFSEVRKKIKEYQKFVEKVKIKYVLVRTDSGTRWNVPGSHLTKEAVNA